MFNKLKSSHRSRRQRKAPGNNAAGKAPGAGRAAGARADSLSAVQDRRQGQRAPVDMFMNRFMNGQPYLCLAMDVSPSGMRLRPLSGPHDDAPSTFMGLQFQVPGCNEILTASCEHVRAADGSVAVRFTHLPEATRTAINQYLQVTV